MIKLDIENAEFEALKGLQMTLTKTKPTVIFEAITPDALHACTSILHSYGYNVKQIMDVVYCATASL